jgi:hypothetical protein
MNAVWELTRLSLARQLNRDVNQDCNVLLAEFNARHVEDSQAVRMLWPPMTTSETLNLVKR